MEGTSGFANMDDAQLRTIWQQRQVRDVSAHVSAPLNLLMNHTLAKRVEQLGRLASLWDEIIPGPIAKRTALESLNRGLLTVVVDSASHRFQLQTLLAAGLEKELKTRYSGTLNKIRIKPGQFYSIDLAGQPRYEF